MSTESTFPQTLDMYAVCFFLSSSSFFFAVISCEKLRSIHIRSDEKFSAGIVYVRRLWVFGVKALFRTALSFVGFFFLLLLLIGRANISSYLHSLVRVERRSPNLMSKNKCRCWFHSFPYIIAIVSLFSLTCRFFPPIRLSLAKGFGAIGVDIHTLIFVCWDMWANK